MYLWLFVSVKSLGKDHDISGQLSVAQAWAVFQERGMIEKVIITTYLRAG